MDILTITGSASFDYFFSIFFYFTITAVPFLLAFVLIVNKSLR